MRGGPPAQFATWVAQSGSQVFSGTYFLLRPGFHPSHHPNLIQKKLSARGRRPDGWTVTIWLPASGQVVFLLHIRISHHNIIISLRQNIIIPYQHTIIPYQHISISSYRIIMSDHHVISSDHHIISSDHHIISSDQQTIIFSQPQADIGRHVHKSGPRKS